MQKTGPIWAIITTPPPDRPDAEKLAKELERARNDPDDSTIELEGHAMLDYVLYHLFGDVKLVKILLEYLTEEQVSRVTVREGVSHTAIMSTMHEDRVDTARMLVPLCSGESLLVVGYKDTSVIDEVAAMGDKEFLLALLERVAPETWKDEATAWRLIWNVAKSELSEDEEMMEWLAENAADGVWGRVGQYGFTLLAKFIERKPRKDGTLARWLSLTPPTCILSKTSPDHSKLLGYATGYCSAEQLSMVLDWAIEVDVSDAAVADAMREWHVVGALTDRYGYEALRLAIMEEHLALSLCTVDDFAFLLQVCPDVITSRNGKANFLHKLAWAEKALLEKHLDVLYEVGADVAGMMVQEDDNGDLPVHVGFAYHENDFGWMRAVIETPSVIGLGDAKGDTILHIAVRCMEMFTDGTLSELLHVCPTGVLQVTNHEGLTAVDVAEAAGNVPKDVLDRLQRSSAKRAN